jgi:hypothetical protein
MRAEIPDGRIAPALLRPFSNRVRVGGHIGGAADRGPSGAAAY